MYDTVMITPAQNEWATPALFVAMSLSIASVVGVATHQRDELIVKQEAALIAQLGYTSANFKSTGWPSLTNQFAVEDSEGRTTFVDPIPIKEETYAAAPFSYD